MTTATPVDSVITINKQKFDQVLEILGFYASEANWEPTTEYLENGKMVTTVIANKDGGDKAREAFQLLRR